MFDSSYAVGKIKVKWLQLSRTQNIYVLMFLIREPSVAASGGHYMALLLILISREILFFQELLSALTDLF